jgi:hypothetical protein
VTVRVSNYKETFEELKEMLEKMILAAAKDDFLKILEQCGRLPPRKDSPSQSYIKLTKVPDNSFQDDRREERDDNSNKIEIKTSSPIQAPS